MFLNGASIATKHFARADALAGATLSLDLDPTRLQPQANTVRIASRGNGRAYYSTVGSFFSTDKSSYQQGTLTLNIARDYFKLVPARDAVNNIVYTLQPLTGPVEQGDVLAVHLGISGSPFKYLLIEDPIPAGAEFIRSEANFNIKDRPSTWQYWYTHREFHDDRASIFATAFSRREESFYLLRVVNPGSFAISPASAQPMYQPGIQATSDELHLDVRDVPPGANVPNANASAVPGKEAR